MQTPVVPMCHMMQSLPAIIDNTFINGNKAQTMHNLGAKRCVIIHFHETDQVRIVQLIVSCVQQLT